MRSTFYYASMAVAIIAAPGALTLPLSERSLYERAVAAVRMPTSGAAEFRLGYGAGEKDQFLTARALPENGPSRNTPHRASTMPNPSNALHLDLGPPRQEEPSPVEEESQERGGGEVRPRPQGGRLNPSTGPQPRPQGGRLNPNTAPQPRPQGGRLNPNPAPRPRPQRASTNFNPPPPSPAEAGRPRPRPNTLGVDLGTPASNVIPPRPAEAVRHRPRPNTLGVDLGTPASHIDSPPPAEAGRPRPRPNTLGVDLGSPRK